MQEEKSGGEGRGGVSGLPRDHLHLRLPPLGTDRPSKCDIRSFFTSEVCKGRLFYTHTQPMTRKKVGEGRIIQPNSSPTLDGKSVGFFFFPLDL